MMDYAEALERAYNGTSTLPMLGGGSVGEWLDWQEPQEPQPHEAVCNRCHLVGNAVLIGAGDCGNCWEASK